MGKQNHAFPFTGRVDTLTFYQTKDGQHMVRKRTRAGGLNTLSPDKYEVAKANMAEFSAGAKAGSLLRYALRQQLTNISDKRLIARVSSQMMKVLKADTLNERGKRNIRDGELNLLQGFDITAISQFGRVLQVNPITGINRSTGKLTVTIPSFIPKSVNLARPQGATHFNIVIAGLELDFDRNSENTDIKSTGLLPVDKNPTGDISIECSVNPASSLVLFLVAGIEFYSDVNGTVLPLDNGAFTALKVLEVSKP